MRSRSGSFCICGKPKLKRLLPFNLKHKATIFFPGSGWILSEDGPFSRKYWKDILHAATYKGSAKMWDASSGKVPPGSREHAVVRLFYLCFSCCTSE